MCKSGNYLYMIKIIITLLHCYIVTLINCYIDKLML